MVQGFTDQRLGKIPTSSPTASRRSRQIFLTPAASLVETGCGEKSVLWKDLENDGKRPYVRRMWKYFFQDRNRVKRFRELAEEEKQAGTQGQWQLESPAGEYLEHVKCCHDTDCTERMMNKGFTALKGGNWEEYKKHLQERGESLGMGL